MGLELFGSVAGQLFLQYFDAVGRVFPPVNCLPDNLYCVGGDVKPCSIQSNLKLSFD